MFGGKKSKQPGASADELIRLLIVDGWFSASKTISKLGAYHKRLEVVGVAFDTEQAVNFARSKQPDCILVNYDSADRDETGVPGVVLIRRIAEVAPRSRIVIEARDIAALGGGVKGPAVLQMLQKPTKAADLWGAINAAKQPHPAFSSPSTVGHVTSGCVMMVVFGGKGGIGKSTIAANLASALGMAGNRVLLVDLDLQFGAAALIASTPSAKMGTILDLVSEDGSVDASGLRDAVVEGPDGLIEVLYPPNHLENADVVTPRHLKALFAELRRRYEVVVVDTPPQLNDQTLAAINATDNIVVVTNTEVPSINNTRKSIQYLQGRGVNMEHVTVVVNQNTPYRYDSLEAMANAIGYPIRIAIPYTPHLVGQSVTWGRPVVIAAPSVEFSQRINALAAVFVPPDDKHGHRQKNLDTATLPEPSLTVKNDSAEASDARLSALFEKWDQEGAPRTGERKA